MAALVLFLLTVGACTEVNVTVHAPAGDGLTGTHCKLKRELKNQHQLTDFWCWAASAHTVIEYVRNEPIEQCDILTAVKRDELADKWDKIKKIPRGSGDPPIELEVPPDCCMATARIPQNPQTPIGASQAVCWANGWPEEVFETSEFPMSYQRFPFDPSFPGPQGLSWDAIVTEICEDRPMISAITFDNSIGGGSHTVVIGGYSELEDGSRWVQVYDPGFNTLEDDYYLWPYEVYLGDPGVFTHVRDYTHIAPR